MVDGGEPGVDSRDEGKHTGRNSYSVAVNIAAAANVLNAILSKARRFGYLPTDFLPLDDLLDASDESLFTSTRYNPQYILHQLLPPPKQISYNLHSRGHRLTLSSIPSEFMRKNFLYRMLYNDIY